MADTESPSERYCAFLSTLGVDPSKLSPDVSGTIRAPADKPPVQVKLPLLRTSNSSDGAADVRMAQLLGEGGMGRVLAARQVALDRDVAVKMLRDPGAPQRVDELLREALVA